MLLLELNQHFFPYHVLQAAEETKDGCFWPLPWSLCCLCCGVIDALFKLVCEVSAAAAKPVLLLDHT